MLPHAVQIATRSCRQAGQLRARRDPPTRPERDVREPGPQERSALPDPQADDHRPRTPRRRQRCQAAPGSSPPATRPVRFAPPGTQRKSSGKSTPSTTPRPRPSSLLISVSTSKMTPARRRCNASGAPSCVGVIRSPLGIGPVTPTARPGDNNLIKRIKRVAFGITNWTNYRTRTLLYAGRPNWSCSENSTLKSEAPSMPALDKRHLVVQLGHYGGCDLRVDCSPGFRTIVIACCLGGPSVNKLRVCIPGGPD